MLGRWLVGGLAAAVLFGSHPLVAQLQRPLTPLPPGGLRVAPFFDGFYRNPDGSATFSFGYSNLNLTDTIEIPVGPASYLLGRRAVGITRLRPELLASQLVMSARPTSPR